MHIVEFVSLGTIGVAMAIMMLLAIWAGRSRRHWFLRAVAAMVALLALYPIRAFEPIVWLAAAMPVTAWLSWVTGRRFERKLAPDASRPSSSSAAYQFRLTDCFLAVLLAGVASAVGAAMWREGIELDWRVGGVVFCGVLLAQLCLVLLLSRSRRRLVAGVALLLGVAAALGLYAWVLCHSTVSQLLVGTFAVQVSLGQAEFFLRLLCGGVLFGPFTAVVLAVLSAGNALGYLGNEGAHRRASHTWTRIIAAAASLALFFPLLAVYLRMIPGPSVPDSPYGGPNSYEAIVTAIASEAALNPAGDESEPEQHYAKLIAALETPGYVPFDFDNDTHYDFVENLDLQGMRNLGRSLHANSENAALKGRFDEASEYALAAIQLGNTVSRGGLIVHGLVGMAIEGNGTYGLVNVRRDVSAEQAAHLLAALQLIEQSREPIELTIARDEAFDDRTYNWVQRLDGAVRWVLGQEDSRYYNPLVIALHQRRSAILRLLIADLAIRQYQAKYGHPPDDLQSLVPIFLPSAPVDPFSDEHLVYRLTKEGFVLYSIGGDGEDNGGRFGTSDEYQYETGLDYDLETTNR